MTCIAGSTMNYLVTGNNAVERVMMLSAGLLMIKPGTVTDLVGIGIAGLVVLAQYIRKNN